MTPKRGSLVDRGANGGIIGNDVFTMCIYARLITGIDNHELNSLKLVDAGAKIMTNKAPLGIFRRVRLSRR
jgi:hypothetical protein